ncbi:WRKY transcription factor 1-like protein [Drosera capensis]
MGITGGNMDKSTVIGYQSIRCYYKCSYRDCLAKKRVEHSNDGHVTGTTYFGKHDHPQPQCRLQAALFPQPSVPVVPAEKPCDVHTPKAEDIELKDAHEASSVVTSDAGLPAVDLPGGEVIHVVYRKDKLTPKRRKISMENADSLADESITESAVPVQTVSPVDVANDGHRMPKYGQKSYYRCSIAFCPARKHVERASHDQHRIHISYEGQHNHDSPPAKPSLTRIVTMTAAVENGTNESKPEDTNVEERESMSTPENNIAVKEETKEQDQTTAADMVTDGNSVPQGTLSEQHTAEVPCRVFGLEIKPKEEPIPDTVHSNSCPETMSNNVLANVKAEPRGC